MRLKKALALIIICAFLLTGCNSDKKYNEYMENGEQAVKQEQYEEALDYFESALDEKEGDAEATALHEQVEKIMQVEAKMKAKLYEEAIELCDEILASESESTVGIDTAKKLKAECEKLKEEQDNLTFREDIEKRISEAKELMKKEEYMNAKVKIGYIIDEISDKANYSNELKECKELLKTCSEKLDEISKKEEADKQQAATDDKKENTTNKNTTNKNDSNKNNGDNNDTSNSDYEIDFNDELKKQIAVAGAAYVEFYFEYGEDTAPSKFAEQAYEDTENDTPLGEYKEQGKTIFMNAFKEAFEATGNEYY